MHPNTHNENDNEVVSMTQTERSRATRKPPTESRLTVNSSWLGMTMVQSRLLLVQCLILLTVILRIIKLIGDSSFKTFYGVHPIVTWAIAVAAPFYILCFSVAPQAWRRYRQAKRAAMTLAYNPDIEGTKYFRLDHYVTPTPQAFRRDDDAHNEVLRWIRNTNQPVLFLSGVSGSGKSSVLEGYVLPMLRAERWLVELIRTFEDPCGQLDIALARRGSKARRLLIVFDQFEQFVILEDRTSAEQRRQFLNRVQELRLMSLPGLCVLFSFRSDYMNDVIGMKIADLVPGDTFLQIDAFKRDAARRFLKGAPEAPSRELVARILAGAETLDNVPARFRPITLNILGLALREDVVDSLMTGQPERLVQTYIARAISQPEIKEIAPDIVERMITEKSTKKPCTVSELASQTGLASGDVLACLVLLANKGLTHRLDALQNLWEISHDFVARQSALLLSSLQPRVWPRRTMFGVAILFTFACAVVIVGISRHTLAYSVFPNNTEKRVALVIGNGAYRFVAELSNPRNDAQLIAHALERDKFTLVGNKALVDLDKSKFEQAVKQLAVRIGEVSTKSRTIAVFYYSGHAIEVNGDNYLAPISVNPHKEADVPVQMVSMGAVLDEMDQGGEACLKIVVLDGGRNNPFGWGGSGLASANAGDNTLIAYSTSPGSVASDGSGSFSPYAEAFAKAIREPGLGLFDVFHETAIRVERSTNGLQDPWISFSPSPIKDDFYFAERDH
jgi:hypothetical protein